MTGKGDWEGSQIILLLGLERIFKLFFLDFCLSMYLLIYPLQTEPSCHSQNHTETLEIIKLNLIILMKKLGWDQQKSNLLRLGRACNHNYILPILCQERLLSLCKFLLSFLFAWSMIPAWVYISAIQILGFLTVLLSHLPSDLRWYQTSQQLLWMGTIHCNSTVRNDWFCCGDFRVSCSLLSSFVCVCVDVFCLSCFVLFFWTETPRSNSGENTYKHPGIVATDTINLKCLIFSSCH